MPRARGNDRGFRSGLPRGRGGGHGRGRGGSRGGSKGPSFRNADELYRGDGTLVFEGSFEDFTLDVVGPGARRGKGPNGRRGYRTPTRGLQHPGDRGGRTPSGKFLRGIGFPKGTPGPRIPLFVLERDRPLLQPVIFVRGVHQKTLFEEVEEILHVPGEGEDKPLDGNTRSTNIIEKIFHHEIEEDSGFPSTEDESTESDVEVEVEAEVVVSAVTDIPNSETTTTITQSDPTIPVGEAIPIGETIPTLTFEDTRIPVESVMDELPLGEITVDHIVENLGVPFGANISKVEPGALGSATCDTMPAESGEKAIEHDATLKEVTEAFVVDTAPCEISFEASEYIIDSSIAGATPLGEIGEDEEIIVYDAPNPRRSRATTPHPAPEIPQPPAFESISLSFSSKRNPDEVLSNIVHTHRAAGLKSTPRSRKLAKKERATARRREERRSLFSMGLNMEERHAMAEASTARRDPRKSQRRRGDSDVDWGSDDEDDSEANLEEVRSGLEEMELDPDIANITTLARFAHRVNGLAGDAFTTLDDLDDIAKMEAEDEEEEEDDDDEDDDAERDGSSNESNDAFDASERREIGEDIESSEDEDDTPRRSFQGRLNRLREKDKAKAASNKEMSIDASSDEDYEDPNMSWADRDEKYLERIEGILDENDTLLSSGDRKARKKMFKAIAKGEFPDDYESFEDISFNSRKKDKHIPAQLQAQWDKDRAKKAEKRREREIARLQEAIEKSPAGKGKLKSKKNKLLANVGLFFDGDTLHTGEIEDLAVLETIIRKFISSLQLTRMILPPKSKDFRKRAHFLADAFNLKSKSQGKGEDRFTTFVKTTRSGVGINEYKVTQLVKGHSGAGFHVSGKAAKTKPVRVKHRDGDVVGQAAPKLTDTNIGFKLLQQMGWAEGDRIGVTGGLADPLTAIIKTTKLGLGATRATY